ncbi:MAG: heat shock protein GrpE [Methanosaeta sp. PtaU1.Bin060]|nr:MAG: heat shock protein GrpE [Methanosaeta sp. PtaU1.Bin060]
MAEDLDISSDFTEPPSEAGARDLRAELDEKKRQLEESGRKLEEAERLAEERLDRLLRSAAELDNVMKIAARERENSAKNASEKLVCKLLPVLDSLDQASKHDEGMRVLHQQLLGILAGEGLAPIESVGKKFDPSRHEALFQVKREDLEEGTVAEEIQKGYLFGPMVIRFSKVAVARR